MELIIAILLLVTTYCTGTIIEKRHYESIRKRELALYKKPYVSFHKAITTKRPVKNARLVAASVVLGCDHFKSFVSSLKGIFGGNVDVYESVLDRARREAILRMRSRANLMNADIVANVKIETVMLTPLEEGRQKHPQVSITAYGTAIEYVK